MVWPAWAGQWEDPCTSSLHHIAVAMLLPGGSQSLYLCGITTTLVLAGDEVMYNVSSRVHGIEDAVVPGRRYKTVPSTFTYWLYGMNPRNLLDPRNLLEPLQNDTLSAWRLPKPSFQKPYRASTCQVTWIATGLA
jgi:hypothetical protein